MVSKTNRRRIHDDGSFSDYVIFSIPPSALDFFDIDQENERVKLQDIAHYQYGKAQMQGEAAPVIVTFGLQQPDRPVAELFPGLSFETEEGERLLSANSAITYTMQMLFRHGWICYKEGVWQTAVPPTERVWQERGTAVLRFLTTKNRLCLKSKRAGKLDFAQVKMNLNQDLIPVAECGFLSNFSQREQPQLAFNTAYFLFEGEDFFSHHSAMNEAYSFWMFDGVVHRPPLFRRGAIWQHENGRWEVGLLGLDDLCLFLPNGWRLVHRERPLSKNDLPFTLNDEGPSDITLYTRYYGVAGQGRVLGFTPVEPGRVELTIIDRRIVGWQVNGGLPLPHNGIVISLSQNIVPITAQQALFDTLSYHFWLEFQFISEGYQTIRQGVQAGPILLQNGQSPLTNKYLEEVEQFWPSRTGEDGLWQMGVVSTQYDTNVDQNRTGRVGIGIDSSGHLILIAAPGVNSGMEAPGVDSSGATLLELAELLREEGAVTAVNLDGGGSTQAYFMGGQAVIPGDRRGIPQAIYQRMIPSIGVVK